MSNDSFYYTSKENQLNWTELNWGETWLPRFVGPIPSLCNYRVNVENTNISVALSVEMDMHSRIEIIPAIVLSSQSVNYKNDIS